MKSKLTAIGVLCLFSAWPTSAATNTASPDRISLYEVPFVCPAAPQIGCGSRSKPILLALEQEAPVAEAWLNRGGTVIAVVWKSEAKRKDKTSTVKAVAKAEEFETRELSGAAKKKAMKEFLNREGWLRGSDVDRLSEEEAALIAARLVRRIQGKVSVSKEKAETMKVEFNDVLKRQFTGPPDPAAPDIHERLLKVIERHLDEKDVTTLKETLPRTARPLPGEE